MELKSTIIGFHAQCSECGSDVPRGSRVFLGPNVVVCLDCMVDVQSDSGLMNRYLKARELDKINRLLKEENNRLADSINELKYSASFNELVLKFDKMLDLNAQYLRTLPGESDPLVVKLRKTCEETPQKLEELRAAVTTKFAPIKRKKKLRKYA